MAITKSIAPHNAGMIYINIGSSPVINIKTTERAEIIPPRETLKLKLFKKAPPT